MQQYMIAFILSMRMENFKT